MGRAAIAHACPIGPNEALTAAHVVDPRPYDKEVPLQPARWSAKDVFGLLVPSWRLSDSDVAQGVSERPFPLWYEAAKEAPKVGDYLWLVNYSWDGKSKAFSEVPLKVKVTRVLAGHVVYEPSGDPGSSGSCVLNASGELVAINSAGMTVGFHEEVGIGVAVWGGWFPYSPEQNKPEDPQE